MQSSAGWVIIVLDYDSVLDWCRSITCMNEDIMISTFNHQMYMSHVTHHINKLLNDKVSHIRYIHRHLMVKCTDKWWFVVRNQNNFIITYSYHNTIWTQWAFMSHWSFVSLVFIYFIFAECSRYASASRKKVCRNVDKNSTSYNGSLASMWYCEHLITTNIPS